MSKSKIKRGASPNARNNMKNRDFKEMLKWIDQLQKRLDKIKKRVEKSAKPDPEYLDDERMINIGVNAL